MTKMVNVKVNGLWDILLPEHRAARPEWTSEGGWEKERLNDIYNTVMDFKAEQKHKPVVYYVGAEEGDMCGLLAQWGVYLVMFEPNEKVLPNIKAIWEANKLPNATIFKGFAGNHTEYAPGDLMAVSAVTGEVISDHGFKNLCERDQETAVVRIDDLVGVLKPPDIISIDVEGSEWEVLRGAEQTLRKHHPRIYLSLHPEFMYEIYKEYAGDLRHWLKQLGYQETLLDYQHEVHLVYEKEQQK